MHCVIHWFFLLCLSILFFRMADIRIFFFYCYRYFSRNILLRKYVPNDKPSRNVNLSTSAYYHEKQLYLVQKSETENKTSEWMLDKATLFPPPHPTPDWLITRRSANQRLTCRRRGFPPHPPPPLPFDPHHLRLLKFCKMAEFWRNTFNIFFH